MPAVQLERLNQEIQDLVSCYTRADEFHTRLVRLLEQHADLTFRSSQAGTLLPPAVESFHVPPLVIQQIERALLREVKGDPTPALALADELWKDSRLEVRMIAASLLGMLPESLLDDCLGRIHAWAGPETDRLFLHELFTRGTVNLRRLAPQRWIDTASQWISSSDPVRQRLGVLALLPIIEDRTFENLPAVFKAISPLFPDIHDLYKNDLRRVLVALSRRTATETAYFLLQMASMTPNPALLKLIRQCLPEFHEETRSRLRSFLQAFPRG